MMDVRNEGRNAEPGRMYGRRRAEELSSASALPALLRDNDQRALGDPLGRVVVGRVGAFYRRHLRRHRAVRTFAQFLLLWLGSIYDWIRGYYIRWFCVHRRLLSFSDRLSSSGFKARVICQREAVGTPHPEVFPKSEGNVFRPEYRLDQFPEIVISRVPSALVIGQSNLVGNGNEVLHHDLYDFSGDLISEERHRRIAVSPRSAQVAWLSRIHVVGELPEAASFCDACAGNYAHWLTEVLPRIHMYRSYSRQPGIPLIVDDGLHENLMASLSLIAGDEVPIHRLPKDGGMLVHSLSVVSAVGYVSFQRRSRRRSVASHGLFSPSALQSTVMELRRRLGRSDRELPKKIFVHRNSGLRLIENAAEIEAALVQRGFSVVEPERLSFAQQFFLFSSADVVVGATGAAMANLLFCRPRTRIVVMMARHGDMPYWYWQNMASAVGSRVRYVLGTGPRISALGFHSDYRVSVTDVLAAVETPDRTSI